MKKLITTFLVAIAAILSLPAQITWDQVKHSTTETPLADTAYFSILCRGGAFQALCQQLPDSVTGAANPGATIFSVGDSVLWRVEKGAALGSSPRIRFINVKTGQYLYMGKKAGATKVPYMAPREDPFNGTKDFLVYDRGPRVPAEYYYGIADAEGSLLGNPSAGVIALAGSDKASDGKYMWRFNKKMGPQPKPEAQPKPELALSAVEPTLFSGGNVTLNAKVTKGATDLLGNALLYHGTTLLDTLDLNSNGEASHIYEGLVYGAEKFALVYTNDANYEPTDSLLTLSVGPNANAKAVTVTITPDATSKEVHNDVNVNFTVTDADNNIVPQGMVYVTVNNKVKNTFTPDVLGSATIKFPNLLVGNDTIGAYYIGDKNSYLNSDTVFSVIEIIASTATEKPYPVYFDLGSIFEVQEYLRKYTSATTTRGFNVNFAADSMKTISLSTDTVVTKTYYAQYNASALSYAGTDYKDLRAAADQFTIPFGVSPRPNVMTIKTPWLNKGSYNIYISQRVNTASGMYPTVALNDKVVYYPNAELVQPSFRTYAGNNVRRWNASGHNANLAMHYFGSVNLETSGVNDLKFTIQKGGESAWLDMIQFIPVDQDSLKVTEASTVGLAKIYYPLFDLGGFARFQGEAALASFSGMNEMAVPYQVVDNTVKEKYEVVVGSLGVTPIVVDEAEMLGNYITIFKAEDKWTRVAEGYITEANNFTCQLPAGDYFYQEIFHYNPGTTVGALNTRYYIKSGTFTVEAPNQVINPDNSKIKVFGLNRTLQVRGIDAGAQILVTDLAGRTVLNSKSQSTTFSATLPQGVFVVKVLSGVDVLRTKVVVK